ncbi:hypothetical protein K7X08_024777 [Anisodus acutangulus]|uniref:F-box domain-containing protein n=1 Tax=Anisodus acutangulus TaxID=402998 RepID=A0A9Q1MBI9_9SOLA|nr:hypothetical protein K7X08_024777 [Anisodus acutangulus]
MIDVLCRSERFNEAENLISEMPFEPDEIMWSSVLNSCRIHKNQDLAKKAADQLFQMDALRDGAAYVNMSNIYAEAGKWENAAKVKKDMREQGVKKVKYFMSSFVNSKKRIERIKGMRNDNRAEELNGVLVIMEMPQSLPDDLLVEIITRLPLKFAVQGKVLNKNLNGRISDPKFSTQLICTSRSMGLFQNFHKISLNPIPTIGCEMNLPYDIELLDSCKGLILFDFEAIKSYCVFNPITRAHQLIPYREPTTFMMISDPGIAVDYPSSNQYKLVTISKLARHSNLFDKFHVLSSDRSGLWREIQLRSNTFSDLAIVSGPVFWRNSLHWLRSDGSVLPFDTNREEAVLIERPKFIDHCDFMYGKILTGCDKWLGVAQGLLTLVCIFKKSIIIAAYDYASSNWRVSHTLENFVSGTVPASIGNLTSLVELHLSYNILEGQVPDPVTSLIHLKQLGFSVNSLSGEFPSSLFNFPSLELISLSYNNFSGNLRPDLGNFFPNLQRLYLAQNSFTGSIPSSFANASKLLQLDFPENNFTGSIPVSFSNLEHLFWLNIWSNHLGYGEFDDLKFLDSLANCSNLEYLHIGVNQFGGILPHSIVNLSTHVTKLIITGNRIHGSIPNDI